MGRECVCGGGCSCELGRRYVQEDLRSLVSLHTLSTLWLMSGRRRMRRLRLLTCSFRASMSAMPAKVTRCSLVSSGVGRSLDKREKKTRTSSTDCQRYISPDPLPYQSISSSLQYNPLPPPPKSHPIRELNISPDEQFQYGADISGFDSLKVASLWVEVCFQVLQERVHPAR